MLSLLARSFRHGVHPDDHKRSTEHLPIERMPFVDRYLLPLGQHIGKPGRAIVAPGDEVVRGQMIAEPDGFVSTALHSPVTGRVVSIARRPHQSGAMTPAIEIETDPYATQRLEPRPVDWRALSPEELVREVQRAGIVGMGGAAFPAHVKYQPPDGKSCDTLVVNGCECEPYLTCDHRVMVERAEAVHRGIEIVTHNLGAERATIGVELNKRDAIEALRRSRDASTDVVGLRVKYPQGAEKMLINALFDQKVPAGKLPIELGMVVNNVGTLAAVGEYFERGTPLIERVVTVSGPGVTRPANLIVPIGTPVREVLRYCGGFRAETEMVILGGPMMGTPIANLDVPVLKGTSGILAFTPEETGLPPEHRCIRCGRCLESCANFLDPSRLARLARAGMYEEMESHYVFDCMECGACTFACPSGIPIVQLIRSAKATLRDRKKS